MSANADPGTASRYLRFRIIAMAASQHQIFSISPDDVAAIDDEGLRELTAELCKATLRNQGMSASAVRHGGNQIAADGGIDVMVDSASRANVSGFVPRSKSGFQVKADDMPRSAIAKEMCSKTKQPDGSKKPQLRESIRVLADDEGAYIIVCFKGSVG